MLSWQDISSLQDANLVSSKKWCEYRTVIAGYLASWAPTLLTSWTLTPCWNWTLMWEDWRIHCKLWHFVMPGCCSGGPLLLVQCQLININKLASGEEQHQYEKRCFKQNKNHSSWRANQKNVKTRLTPYTHNSKTFSWDCFINTITSYLDGPCSSPDSYLESCKECCVYRTLIAGVRVCVRSRCPACHGRWNDKQQFAQRLLALFSYCCLYTLGPCTSALQFCIRATATSDFILKNRILITHQNIKK
jgi:hypothetical protein